MKVSQRQVVLALLMILVFGSFLTLAYELLVPSAATTLSFIGTIISVLAFTGLLLVYWRGWEPARYLTLILLVLLVGFVTDQNYLIDTFTMSAFLPPVLAIIVAGPAWVIGSAVGVLAILISRAGLQSIYTDPIALMLYSMFVGGMLLARLVTDTAQSNAEENARQTQEALARSEAQAQELVQKTQELEYQNKQQRQLLDLVSTLETPAVSLAEGVLLAPIVGHLDSRRAGDLTRRLLGEVSTQRAKLVILDIAGVATVDTAVAQSILRAIQAIRLLGCEVTVTGISSSVAATMTDLGINMAGVRTARTPQEVMGSDWQIHPRPSKN